MADDQREPDVVHGLSPISTPGRGWRCRQLSPNRSRRRWCETLSISSQQLVEIAKALTLDCRILILDEPTAALTEREAQRSVRHHAQARRPRHLDHLYLAPHGRDLRQLRPRHRLPRRPPHRHRRTSPTSTPTTSSTHGGPGHRQALPAKQSPDERRPASIILEVRQPHRRRPLPRRLLRPPAGRDPRHRRADRRRAAARSSRGSAAWTGRRPATSRSTASRCPFAATATASTTASSICRRTARATASSSTCRSPPMSRRSTFARSSTRWGIDRRRAGGGAGRARSATGSSLKRGQHSRSGVVALAAATSRRSRSPRCCRSIRA